MTPLVHQMFGYKKQIENRLVILKSLKQSKENLYDNLVKLEKELDTITTQRNELNEIVKVFEGDSAQFLDKVNN